MKKKILTAAILAAVLLSSCGSSTEGTSDTTSVAESVTTSATETTPAGDTTSAALSEAAVKFGITKENFPLTDGSTSTIPLDAGIRAALFNLSQAQTESEITHTTTHKSFERLLNGEVDAIFTVPISAEQSEMAAEKGITLESIPAAMEGFVFVVNADNPVDSLTQEQIKGIYAGRITNWSEVGGNDAEIIPFQRNPDSGSQNYMRVFMQDDELIEAKSEYMLYGMAGILDAISNYDNGVDSIGYSVYSYAAEMYNNENGIKFIAVDGVAPSLETMASKDYPLLSCTYFMYSADEAADSPVRKLAEFITSAEGQEAVERSGYVKAHNIS